MKSTAGSHEPLVLASERLQTLFLAVSLSSLAQLAPPLLHLRLHWSLLRLSLFTSGSWSVFGSLSVSVCVTPTSVCVTPTSLCLHLSLSPPRESHLPLYISDLLVSVSLPSRLFISLPLGLHLALCAPISLSLSLPPFLFLSPSVYPYPPLCLCLSASMSPCILPCSPQPAQAQGPRWRDIHAAAPASTGPRLLLGFSTAPSPRACRGRSQSSAWPAGDSHSPLWGPRQPGIGTNSSLEQTLCHH